MFYPNKKSSRRNHWILTNEGNEFLSNKGKKEGKREGKRGRKKEGKMEGKRGRKRKKKWKEKGRKSDISIQYKTIMTLIGSIINAT